jgi:hypothetical protein
MSVDLARPTQDTGRAEVPLGTRLLPSSQPIDHQ